MIMLSKLNAINGLLSLRISLTFFLMISFGVSSSYAQSSISVEVDRELISTRQTVRATVTISLDGASSQANLGEPSWQKAGWSVLSRSSSTSLSLINGHRSLEVTNTYQLKPLREGELTVGPFIGHGTASGLTSNTVKVKVSKKAPPVNVQEQQKSRVYTQVRWGVDQQEVWLGESIEATLTVYVLNRLNLVDLNAPSIDLKGFWSRELETPRRSARVELDGRIYYQQMIKRDQLTPLKVGDLFLPELDLTVTVGTQRLFSENHDINVKVDPVKIKVKPLPPNPPPGFKGPAVGEVKLTATLDRSRIRQDESVQLIIKTETTGMLTNIPKIELPYLDGLRSFPPSEREFPQTIGGVEKMIRLQTWLIKPERAGEFNITSLELPYFSPKLGEYAVAQTRALKLKVRENPNASPQINSGLQTKEAKSNIQVQTRLNQTQTAEVGNAERLGIQLNSVLTEPLATQNRAWPLWVWWLIGLLGPLIFIINECLFLMTHLRAKGSSNRAQNRAARQVLSALSQLKSDALDYAKLDELLLSYLEARLQLNLRGVTREQVAKILEEAGISSQLIASYEGLRERIDLARFSPSFNDQKQAELLHLSTEWIKLIEGSLKESKAHKNVTSNALTLWVLVSISSLGYLNIYDVHAEKRVETSSKGETSASTQETQWAQEGNHAFWSNNYPVAIQAYQQVLERDPQDAGIWYNLSVAHAHAGNLGESVYALERAHLLASTSPLIIEQLSKIHQMVITEGTRNPGNRRLILPDEVSNAGGILAFFKLEVLRAFTLTLFSIACLGFTILRRRARRETDEESSAQLKRMKHDATLRVISLLMLVSSLLSGGAWWAKQQASQLNQGIVISNRVALHQGPGKQYKAEVNIAGGVKLELQGSHEGWRRVKLLDGRAGWLRSDEVRALKF